MNKLKTFNKGASLFKDGDKITNIMIIESGIVSIFLPRGKQNIELYQVSKSQVLGEQALTGALTYKASAVAVTETKVIEVPVDVMKAQVEGSSQLTKLLIKALGDRLKFLTSDLRSLKLEKDPTPMPSTQVPKAFGVAFHVANHTGQKKEDRVTVDWKMYKAYASRIFLEDAKRLEQVVTLLVKLKLAEIEMIKDPEDPKAVEEVGYVHFFDLTAIEQFFEFHQYYSNKSGKQDLLKVDETCFHLVEVILKMSEDEEPDRLGNIRLDYTELVEFGKEEGININKDHFALLELKGLFVKRATTEDGGAYLSYNSKEFASTFQNWRFLVEVDKWNDKGFVDLNEAPVKKHVSDSVCPSCSGGVDAAMKFCPHCGVKLGAHAAA